MFEQTHLALWGGIEATRNRVGDRFFDQLDRSGHAVRIDDLDAIAALGIKTLRYPILWERIAPNGLQTAEWAWPDARLARLHALGVTPIVTLVHHGSGPAHVDLLNPEFASGLAAFAGAVAARYPWITDFTPVNEPLTTARFSALYGHWHPHLHDMRATVEVLLNETRATMQAMAAIRAVHPDARLIQTEDIGKIFSTPALRTQARFENERRWLGLDLLCGTVRPGHALWDFLMWLGFDQRRLQPFSEDPCPPDVIGVNYYVTGERFLDQRTSHYPAHTHGGNKRRRYADVEAVRVRGAGLHGLENILLETWQRFRLSMAVTECHLGASADEQIRWLEESWQAALAARAAGADVWALTVWSLLGAFDWDSLVTCERGSYEPGAFDVRAGVPRETDVAAWVRARANGRTPPLEGVETPGWWRRPERLLYPPNVPAEAFESPVFALAGD